MPGRQPSVEPVVTATVTCGASCPFRFEAAGGGEVTDTGDLSVCGGEVLWLKGPSGVGKSSIARVFAGIDATSAIGFTMEVRWRADLDEKGRSGVLFQEPVLIDGLTLRENLQLASADVDVAEALRRVALLEGDADKLPDQLSLGTREGEGGRENVWWGGGLGTEGGGIGTVGGAAGRERCGGFLGNWRQGERGKAVGIGSGVSWCGA